MKIASKIIVWIVSIALFFVLVNLGIGLFKHKSISNYADFLNQKDWQSAISQIDIKNPSSIFSIFYGDSVSIKKDTNKDLADTEIIAETKDEISLEDESNNSMDHYDPEFQDEFNEFFGTTQLEENEEFPWFIDPNATLLEEESDESQETVSQQLIEKFSQ